MGKISSFFVIVNPEGTKRIECRFIVYREKFGHHPSFLKDYEGNAREGFNTKFFFVVVDDLSDEEAETKLLEFEEKYNDIVTNIENDDTKWDEFPFKDCPISYYK